MLDLEKMTFLTREQLREQAPTVFALKPSSEVSKKYTHIPTLKVVEDMEKLGIYECSEEDFALCSLICQSKIEVSQIIQEGLDLMYEEG